MRFQQLRLYLECGKYRTFRNPTLFVNVGNIESMREFTESEALQLLAFMNKLVVGLDRLGSSYHLSAEDRAWASDYVFSRGVFKEAAQVRNMIHSKYKRGLEEGQDQDEIEQLLEDLQYWEMPTLKQLERFKQKRRKE